MGKNTNRQTDNHMEGISKDIPFVGPDIMTS